MLKDTPVREWLTSYKKNKLKIFNLLYQSDAPRVIEITLFTPPVMSTSTTMSL